MNSLRQFLFLAPLLWSTSVLAAGPITWHGATEIAQGPGEKGPWQQNNSRYHYVDDPAVIIDQRRNVGIAWVEQSRKDIFFQRLAPDGGKQLTIPVNVSRSPATFSWLPRMERAPDVPGKIYMLWQEIIFSGGSHGGEILFAYSDDNGKSFSQPINISNSQSGDGKGRINPEIWHNGSFDLVAGRNGAVYATWTEYDGPLWFSRSTDGGKTFSTPQRIAGGGKAKPVRAPSLALGKERALYLAWTTGEDEGADIHLVKSTDGGASFGQAQTIAPNDRYSDAPKLAVGPDDALHLVYAESNGGPFDEFHILYTRSDDGGQTFQLLREISNPLPSSIESVQFPYLRVDAKGRVIVAYELYPNAREAPRGLGITVSMNGGRDFSAPAVVPDSASATGGTNGSHQGWLMEKLAVGAEGQIVIVNSSLKKGEQSRVWLIRGELKPLTPGN